MKPLALVFLFGGIGSVLRHLANLGVLGLTGLGFPWGILIINIAGCALIGFLARVVPLPQDGGAELRLMLMTGLCGGFTTFSAFSLDAADLWLRGDQGLAVSYVAASMLLCLTGVALGISLGQAVAA